MARGGFNDIDLSSLDPMTLAALEEVARRKHQLQMIQAQKEQDALAREMANIEVSAVDGFGPMQRRIHGDAYHDWALKGGGYEVWGDSGFLKYFDRIAPETKVKYRRKPQVGWTEHLPQIIPIGIGRDEKRFVKRYGAFGTEDRPHPGPLPRGEGISRAASVDSGVAASGVVDGEDVG